MDNAELGHRLRSLRAASGKTVADVAALAGLSVPYIANLENGRGNPTLDALRRLATALGADLRVELGAAPGPAADPLPPVLVRLGRGQRFRDCVAAIGGPEPGDLAGRLLAVLASAAAVSPHPLTEADCHRLLDALLLITRHPA
ncbi:helix-turn-helix domain-containing protein [Actinokineospora fastidiosa]|uniref:HTH cro/C1-type domain-containing protein n=1 Tax=Actinokineospora fastidiosa TaxID=1816 RepID=A0A918GMP9_9PSEU|nr:helix-turn-helix transcriptional regulator [Actinokineospora fastidiosa]GGS47210.1 hypothetical protein GCM10010171_48050 [Actinokineospora fastidiosa]